MRNKKHLQVWALRLSMHQACQQSPTERAVLVQLKQLRREVADLLRANKQENARIRVEAVIQEQKMLRT